MEVLNAPQKEAVNHTEGPLLILAGAGAGKTRVIAERIGNLVARGTDPRNILAVTFTNKAAGEMRERVKALLEERSQGRDYELPFVSTFHALGVYVLRNHGHLVGLKKRFTIFDRDDAIRALKEAIVAVGLSPKEVEPGRILGAISRQKNLGRSAFEFGEGASGYFEELVAEIWPQYEKILSREQAVDFDDLLVKTVSLLKRHPMVLSEYQNKWRYIHIDEYQDINRIQYELARLLSLTSQNLCVVGDIDQNIYSWRGADIEHILNFENHFSNTKVVLLLENYRSTKVIVEASNEIIEKNKRRREKILFTQNEDGEKISLVTTYSEVDEASFIADACRELIKERAAPKDIAVLFRANFQSRVLEEAFLAAGLPYQVVGVRFFERKEVKDTLSYLRAALNPESISDLKRVVNLPPRGIGKVALLKIIEGKVDQLPAKTHASFLSFKKILETIAEYAETKKPSETLAYIFSASGIKGMLEGGSDDDTERLENIKELVTVAQRYDKYPPREGIEKLLEESALASDQDELKDETNAVRLMTVHASKGLEFDYVFVTGLEDGLFPHARHDDGGDPEEERRLFYVALTRARKKVYLTYASTRTIFGSQQVNAPSEFILDIDERHLEAEEGIKTIIID